MKITKTLLKQIIKEELEAMDEERPVAPTGAEKEKHEKRKAARKKCVDDAMAKGRTKQQAEGDCKGAGSLEKEKTDESVESVDETVNEKVEDIYESLTRRLERLERLIGD